MAASSSNNWKGHEMKDDDASSKMDFEGCDRMRQLAASRIPAVVGGTTALPGGSGLPGALEMALLQQQKAQFPSLGAAFAPRISDDQLVAAAAAGNSNLSMALSAHQDANAMFPTQPSRSPLESAQLHPLNPKTNILGLSMLPTMTSPYAAHLQMAQRAFQIQQVGHDSFPSGDQAALLTSPVMASLAHRLRTQQNQEQLVQQQRQLLLQLGSGSMEDNSNLPALSSISNLEILQYLEQKQQQHDLQAKMLAAAAASKPPAAPAAPSTTTSSSSTSLTTRKESSFPLKLHSILANPEFQEFITWLPNGRSWRILKPAAFERVVIPLVFRHAKYASFMRQVNGWGFKRITGGPASGAAHNSYFHQYFIRDYPQLCLQMKRVGKTPTGAKGSSSEHGGSNGRETEHGDDASVTSVDVEET